MEREATEAPVDRELQRAREVLVVRVAIRLAGLGEPLPTAVA